MTKSKWADVFQTASTADVSNCTTICESTYGVSNRILDCGIIIDPNQATVTYCHPETKSESKEEKKCCCKPLMPEVIMENVKQDKTLKDGTIKKGGLYTTVKWNDGTYTTVKVSQNDASEKSPYMAFCAALAKKLYGSNAAVHRVVNHHLSTYLEAQKKLKEEAKFSKELEAKEKAHERAVLREAKRLRLKEEAKAYNRALKEKEG